MAKSKCILGIGQDGIHLTIKMAKKSPSPKEKHKHRRISSMKGSLTPHFTYVFKLPSDSKIKQINHLQQHRWIDLRVLTKQKNCRLKQWQTENKPKVSNITDLH